MKKLISFSLFLLSSIGIQAQAQVDGITPFKYDKFWEVLDRNYISYAPNGQWIVEADTLTYVFDNINKEQGNTYGQISPINQRLGGMHLGRLMHRDGKCILALDTSPKRMDGKKLTIPLREEAAKDYVFSRIGNHFGFMKPGRSLRRQALKDVEMLVTYYPTETAKDIFNGVSMFVYPLNFQGETYRNQYTCGRGVVVFSKHNVPLELYFLMTDESIKNFDKYLSELKGVFTFQNIYE